MNSVAGMLFARGSHFGTEVPESLIAFDWHKETTRTICSKGRFHKT